MLRKLKLKCRLEGIESPKRILSFPIVTLVIKENIKKKKLSAYKGYSIQKDQQKKKEKSKIIHQYSKSIDLPKIKVLDIKLQSSQFKGNALNSFHKSPKNYFRPPAQKLKNSSQKKANQKLSNCNGQGQSMLIREKNKEIQNLADKNKQERQFQRIKLSHSFEYQANEQDDNKECNKTKQSNNLLSSQKPREENTNKLKDLSNQLLQSQFQSKKQKKLNFFQSQNFRKKQQNISISQEISNLTSQEIKQVSNEKNNLKRQSIQYEDNKSNKDMFQDIMDEYQIQNKHFNLNQNIERDKENNDQDQKKRSYHDFLSDQTNNDKIVSKSQVFQQTQDVVKDLTLSKKCNEKVRIPPIRQLQYAKNNQEYAFLSQENMIAQQSPYTKIINEIDQEGLTGWKIENNEEDLTPITKTW